MAWATAKGFNFRSTSGYVTDPSNTTYVLTTDTYSTTRSIGGENVTFGYSVTGVIDARDRSTTSGREKLAGMHFQDTAASPAVGSSATFRVDLPEAGTYKFRFGMGDASDVDPGTDIEIYDDTSLLTTIQTVTTGTDKWMDATEVEHASAVAWYSSNTQTAGLTFATTTCLIKFIGTATAGARRGHVEIEQQAAAGGGLLLFAPDALGGLGGM